ncbi:glycosyltransferase [Caballeronia sp. S22]|uniref:glycosyltransferase family 2 protein n=1 Tax=Caballeronia sp. S22 TaxID=3137182 RepID=UPI0035317487
MAYEKLKEKYTAPAAIEEANQASRIAELEALLADALENSKANSVLQNKILELETELSGVHESLSWRITRPLRALNRLGTAYCLAIQTVRRQVLMRGGLTHALAYYVSTIRREGIGGIRARVARLQSGIGFADGPPSDEAYGEWIARYDTIDDEAVQRMRAAMQGFARQPLISVVVPVYNSDPVFLQEMIESVRAQVYPHWELCIADDASTNPEVRDILQAAAAADSRIRLAFRKENGHISEASNTALALATGELVALLDHDDVLPPHALFMVALYSNRHPDARMFYSDEDKLDAGGRRTMPFFKSDWNPEMFLSRNMFSHLGVISLDLIRQVGGFRRGFEGSQDYDLALRCVEAVGDGGVVHIPHILYHWRIVPGSTAGSAGEKPYAQIAARRALEEHLIRQKLPATLEEPSEHLPVFRIRYAVAQPEPLVTIIVSTRDGGEPLLRCLGSIRKRTIYRNYEIIVIESGSEHAKSLASVGSLGLADNVRVIHDPSPFSFVALCNRAVAEARGAYLCLLDSDIEVMSPGWLNEMVSLAARPGTGAVGARLWYLDGKLRHGGFIIGLGGVAGPMHHMLARGQSGYFQRAIVTQNLSAVTAACLVVGKKAYYEVGGLDESLALAFNDVDFCLRLLEAGYRNVWTPYAELHHHEPARRGSNLEPEKQQRFMQDIHSMEARWGQRFGSDPAYNPNLSLAVDAQPFTLASPPRVGQFD